MNPESQMGRGGIEEGPKWTLVFRAPPPAEPIPPPSSPSLVARSGLHPAQSLALLLLAATGGEVLGTKLHVWIGGGGSCWSSASSACSVLLLNPRTTEQPQVPVLQGFVGSDNSHYVK